MIKLLITGGNGQLGRAINNLYKDRADIECINTDVGELDITNLEEVLKFVEECKPYAIINCAAHTAVDLCEDQEELAYKINAIGPRNLSIAAEKNGAKILHISTDYVFAGDATEPYKEFDIPNPQGVYGASKLAGENFVKTMLRLAEDRDEIGVVYDQVGSPTSTFELAKAMDSLLFTENYGTFHGTCEGICSWADFAEEIFKIAGKNVKVNRLTSDEYPAKAKRPAYSVLENYMFKITNGVMFADWHDALKEYMKWLNENN